MSWGKRKISEDRLLATHRPDLRAEYSPNNTIDFDTLALTSGKPTLWICNKGHEYESTTARRVGQGSGCPYCAGKRAIPGVNDVGTTDPWINEHWSEKNPPVTDFKRGSKKVVTFVCPDGHERDLSVVAVAKNGRYRCPTCSSFKYRRPEYEIYYHPDNELPFDQVAAETMKELLWRCPKGHEWKQIGQHMFKKTLAEPCAECRTLAGGQYQHLLNEWAFDLNEITPQEVTHNSKQSIWWRCKDNPEHTWQAQPSNRAIRNSGCPRCRQSSGEKELTEFVRGLGVEVHTGRRDIITPLEIDLYLPEYRIAIEYNGVYWHSDPDRKDHHKRKYDRLREEGIRLLVIWEDDWLTRRDVAEAMIRHKLGLATERLGARQTVIDSNVRYDEATAFMERHHIQGMTRGTRYLGLRDNTGDLVACMILRRGGTSRQKSDQWLLARYATSKTISGGFTKMMKHLRDLGITSLITFADHSVSDGSLYENTGWTNDGEIAPDYMYVHRMQRLHKFNFRRKRFETDPKLKYDPSLSETQLAELNGIRRVYDYGKTRYTITL